MKMFKVLSMVALALSLNLVHAASDQDCVDAVQELKAKAVEYGRSEVKADAEESSRILAEMVVSEMRVMHACLQGEVY